MRTLAEARFNINRMNVLTVIKNKTLVGQESKDTKVRFARQLMALPRCSENQALAITDTYSTCADLLIAYSKVTPEQGRLLLQV